MPPRIAIAFEFGTLSGGEHSMLAVLDHSPAGSFEVVALAPPQGRLADELGQRGIDHMPLDLRDAHGTRLPRRDACRNLREAIHHCSPALVHANSLSMGRLTGALADELAVPAIAHLRDILKLSAAAAADLNRHHRLIAVSRATRDYLVTQGVESERIDVVHNGVDCNRFRPRPATGELRRELGLSPDSFLIATIGQICLRKGHDVLAEAAVRAGGAVPHAHYLIVGERQSSKRESVEFAKNIGGQFARPGLQDRLHQLGYRSDVNRLLNEVDLLVHPAKQEPFGRVLLEAAASGLPIVATDVGGTAEMLVDGASARLVPVDDAAALAAAIIELHDDPSRRRRFAEAARRRVERDFPIDRAVREVAAVWSEAIGDRGAGGC